MLRIVNASISTANTSPDETAVLLTIAFDGRTSSGMVCHSRTTTCALRGVKSGSSAAPVRYRPIGKRDVAIIVWLLVLRFSGIDRNGFISFGINAVTGS